MLCLLVLGEAILLASSMPILHEESAKSFDNVPNSNGQSLLQNFGGPTTQVMTSMTSNNGIQQSLSILDPVITRRTLNPSMLSKSEVENELPRFVPISGRNKDSVVFGESTTTDDGDNKNRYRRNAENTTCKDNEVFFQSKCYNLLKQGPCKPNQWLVEINGKGECKDTTCHFPQISYNGTCYDYNLLRNTQFQHCPAGMTLSPSKDGTVGCDCLSRYLYNSKDGKCYKAYSPGPCRWPQYFILPKVTKEKQDVVPTCAHNPCKRVDYVCLHGTCSNPLQSDCVKIGSSCMDNTGRYEVNLESPEQEVACISLKKLETEPKTIANVPSFACSKGSKRDVNGVCRKTTSFTFS